MITGVRQLFSPEVMAERLKALEAEQQRGEPRDGSGGGGDNGDMDATRIDKLESFAERTGERLTRVEEKLDFVAKEVGQFKWWIVGQIAALFLAVIGTGIATQQMTVATFQGAAQVAKDAAPQAAQAPIIINVPAPAAPAK